MREEYIDYMEDLPIKIYLAKIGEYPIHWHNSTELIFILKGSLDIQIGIDTYHVSQGQIEIVNHNEVHSMKSNEDNLVLILNISPSFFKKYYRDLGDMYFYADSSNREVQKTEKYQRLRQLIALIYYEFLMKYEDYQEALEEELIKLIYHLLNNFHYLFYEEESLRDDEIELERYHRIVSFIQKNYMNKISLKEVADREFLSSQYLSYKIKNTFGYSFIDFLNLIRVEESTKLLLTSDKSISDIALETGFSHVRYYNKHFKKHYRILPRDYREKYKISSQEFENLKNIEYFELVRAYDYLKDYIVDYHRFNYDEQILMHELDIRRDCILQARKELIFSLSLRDEFFIYNDFHFKEILKDISIDGIIVEDIGSGYKFGSPGFNDLEALVRNVLQQGIRLYLDLPEADYQDFLAYMKSYNSGLDLSLLGKNNFEYSGELSGEIYDSLAMLGPIIEGLYYGGHLKIQRLYDRRQSTRAFNTFYGGGGLITENNLKKPSYFIYEFISRLGDQLIYLEENMIVTRDTRGFQLLIFNYKSKNKRKLSINILGLKEAYRLVEYRLDRNRGSVYDSWRSMGSPRVIESDYLDLMRRNIRPSLNFHYAPPSNVFNIFIDLDSDGLVLYEFNLIRHPG